MLSLTSEHTRTPIDGRSLTDRSWKSKTSTLVEEKKENRPRKSSSWKEWLDLAPVHDERRGPNWKPLSMTTPILSAVILGSILMVVAIEFLAQKSQKQGGLALSPSLDEIPQYAILLSQYLPQVLAVVYSLVWSWIDLDVKRMQPWYEMAKPGGALAKDSLLLDYPYTFVAAVPIQAARRKHWLVFLSGTAMVLIFWVITPLQSAQLGTGQVRQSVTQAISNRSALAPLSAQEDLLTSEIMNKAYAIAWLDQPFPKFTTAKEAYLPFYVDDQTASRSTSQKNFTSRTTKLWTELDCWPAISTQNESNPLSPWIFSDGKGCNASVAVSVSPHNWMFYIGYKDSPYSNYWLYDPTQCPEGGQREHQMLAIWSSPVGNVSDVKSLKYNITSLFCLPSYYKQEVSLTVDSDTLTPDEGSIRAVGARRTLSEDEFNSTAFEFLLANGMPDNPKPRDYPFSFVVEQHPKLVGRNLSSPVSTMVGFALAGQNLSTPEYSNPEVLKEAFQRAHKYMFATAIGNILLNTTEFGDKTASTLSFVSGILVSRPISAALEAFLLMIALFVGIIIWICHGSHSNLHRNPSSISRMIEIFRNSPGLLDDFSCVDNADDESLLKITENDKYRLVWSQRLQVSQIIVENNSSTSPVKTIESPRGYYKPVKPLALRMESGIAFGVSILAILVGLGYLKSAEVRFSGLRRPSSNQEVQQILENYIPTMFATLVEPFWVLVNRLLCVLQPFKDLWRGQAKPDRSISTTYTSVPPQFVFWRAIKARHFILPLVCSAVFLANILTVSMPALFREAEVVASYTMKFEPITAPTFKNQSVTNFSSELIKNAITSGSYEDHNYAALANMSMGTPLPPWVASDYFFQPWKLPDIKSGTEGSTFKLRTRGFGVKMNCSSIPNFLVLPDAGIKAPDNPNGTKCANRLDAASYSIRNAPSPNLASRGPWALEYVATESNGINLGYPVGRGCDQALTLGWARLSDSSKANGTINVSFANCKPIFQTAMFEVQTDMDGRVRSYTRVSKVATSLDYPEAEKQAEILIETTSNLLSEGASAWHNDTISDSWMSYFLYLESGSRFLLDPRKPLPDPKDVIPQIDGIYRKLFSLILALNSDYLFEILEANSTLQGEYLFPETRLFLDQPAFIISSVLLIVNIIFALILYFQGVIFVLPRMPTTLGSIVAYVAPSRMVEELGIDEGSRETSQQPSRLLSFGRFIGRDGGTHIGIEMDPHVVPIDPASFGKKKVRWRWLTGAKEGAEGTEYRRDPWL